jgi:hypothetical protein
MYFFGELKIVDIYYTTHLCRTQNKNESYPTVKLLLLHSFYIRL